MPKHIKVRLEAIKGDPTAFTMKVISYTHTGFSFGGNIPGKISYCFGHGRIRFRADDALAGTNGFRINDDSNFQVCITLGAGLNNTVKIPIEYHEEVRAAVKAYNEWGATKP